MTKKFSIKKLVAGVLAAAMVVTALPVSGLTAKAADEDTLRVYRSYNPNSGEHLYTTNAAEQAMVVAQGRSDEGVKFLVPSASSTPVYRVYNENSGEHLLVPKGEAEGLAKIPGWNNEGIKMYSDDNKGVPIYRVYNPDPNAGAGAHLYTSKEEAAALVAIGWNWDNNGEPMIYGVDKEATEELALEKVEDASGGVGNVIIAYFSRPVGDLTTTDLQIRRVSDDQLFPIESVVMSSDKKSATIKLNSSDATIAATLDPNVDYNLIATTASGKASKVFSIPGTITEATVYEVDPENKTIAVEQLHYNTVGAFDGANGTFTVPDDFEIDYEELLGRTVTVQFDKNNNLTKLSRSTSETVVFGAFKVDATKETYTDILTKKVYRLQKKSGAQEDAQFVSRAPKGKVTAWATGGAGQNINAVIADGNIAWAKLVVNGSNQIKMAVQEAAWTGCIKVGEVKNDSVVDGKTEISLKDYVILKDGKTIKTSDLKAGDVVYYNTTDSFAEVYNNEVTGSLDAVYTGSVKVAGKEYALKGTDANITYETKHSVKDDAEKTVDNDYLNALKASGKDVTARLNRANQLVFLDGTTAEVKSSTKTIVLTDNAKYYTQSLSEYIRIKGSDGTEEKTYDIDVTGLKKFTREDGEKVNKGENFPGTTTEISKYKFTATAPDLAISCLDSNGATIGNVTGSIAGSMKKGELIALNLNDKDEVVGIDFVGSMSGTADVTATGTALPLTGTADDGKFRAGYTTLNGMQLAATTPLFIYDASDDSVTAMAYGQFTGAEKAAGTNGVRLYTADKKNIAAIVVDKSALDSDTDGATTTEGIVVRAKYDTSSDKKMNEFSILVGSEIKEYSKFSGTITTALEPGDIVAVKVLKDGVTVAGFDQTAATIGATVSGTITVTKASDNTFKIGNAGPYNMATTGKVQYGKLADGVITSVDLATIIKEGASNTVVATTNGTANYIDSIVVKMSTNADAQQAAADAVSAALSNLSTVMAAAGTADEIHNADEYAKFKEAYDNVDALYATYKSLDDTATTVAADFVGDPNVGDYATCATEMDAWKGVEATIGALSLTVSGNTSIDLPLKGQNSPLGVATTITWAETDGAVADATVANVDADKDRATVAITAGDIGTFKLVATITNGNSDTTVPYAVLCGTAGANKIDSVSKIVDETKYDAAQLAATEANITPAAFTFATTGTSAKIKSVVETKASATAALDGVTFDTTNLKLYEAAGDTETAEPASVANDYWAGKIVMTTNGYVTTVDITKADNWKMAA